MQTIRIYKIGCDYYAAANLRGAVREFEREAGDSWNRRELLEEAQAVSDAEMDVYEFLDDPENEDTARRTFREELAAMQARGVTFPTAFACSDY